LQEAKRELLDLVQLPLENPTLLKPGLKRSGILLFVKSTLDYLFITL